MTQIRSASKSLSLLQVGKPIPVPKRAAVIELTKQNRKINWRVVLEIALWDPLTTWRVWLFGDRPETDVRESFVV